MLSFFCNGWLFLFPSGFESEKCVDDNVLKNFDECSNAHDFCYSKMAGRDNEEVPLVDLTGEDEREVVNLVSPAPTVDDDDSEDDVVFLFEQRAPGAEGSDSGAEAPTDRSVRWADEESRPLATFWGDESVEESRENTVNEPREGEMEGLGERLERVAVPESSEEGAVGDEAGPEEVPAERSAPEGRAPVDEGGAAQGVDEPEDVLDSEASDEEEPVNVLPEATPVVEGVAAEGPQTSTPTESDQGDEAVPVEEPEEGELSESEGEGPSPPKRNRPPSREGSPEGAESAEVSMTDYGGSVVAEEGPYLNPVPGPSGMQQGAQEQPRRGAEAQPRDHAWPGPVGDERPRQGESYKHFVDRSGNVSEEAWLPNKYRETTAFPGRCTYCGDQRRTHRGRVLHGDISDCPGRVEDVAAKTKRYGVSVEVANGFKVCEYPLCSDPSEHRTKVCPTLHRYCRMGCEERGHPRGRCAQGLNKILEYRLAFEGHHVKGVYTGTGKHDWGVTGPSLKVAHLRMLRSRRRGGGLFLDYGWKDWSKEPDHAVDEFMSASKWE